MPKRYVANGLALLSIITILAILVSCGPTTAVEEPVATIPATETKPASSPEPFQPTEAASAEAPSPKGPGPLPAEPQVVEFEAADGQALAGTWYPAAVNPAPAVVLMHWVRADQSDWSEVAFWLQNRGLGGTSAKTYPWLDPTWFPPMPENVSYGVLTFSFRGCAPGGCADWVSDKWLLDAQAAMDLARELPGADLTRLAAIGASIGGDGAIDGCFWLDEESGEFPCRGALSLSPGGYLGVDYAEAVRYLAANYLEKSVSPDPGYIASWCLASKGDADSARTCGSAPSELYMMNIYPGDAHGMALIQPGMDPDTLEVAQQFLGEVLGK